MSFSKNSCHIIIVGAGLSGLSASIGLAKAGYNVTVLEKAPELRQVGAGIQIPINGAKALHELGVLDKIFAHSIRPVESVFHSYKGESLYALNLDPHIREKYGFPFVVIRRAQFCNILYEEAQCHNVRFRFDCAVENINFEQPAVILTNGETVLGDLVLGCDGDRSICRELLLGKPDPPILTGIDTYRIVLDVSKLQDDLELAALVMPPRTRVWAGPESHLVSYLLGDLFNVVFFLPGQASSTQSGPELIDLADVRPKFENWDPRIQKLLGLADQALRWPLTEVKAHDEWMHGSGKFTLIGDSAHACLPCIAHGASIGVESAVLLSKLLARASYPAQFGTILRRFNQARLPRASFVISRSRFSLEQFHMRDGEAQRQRDHLLRNGKPSEGFPFCFADPTLQDRLWAYDINQDANDIWKSIEMHKEHAH